MQTIWNFIERSLYWTVPVYWLWKLKVFQAVFIWRESLKKIFIGLMRTYQLCLALILFVHNIDNTLPNLYEHY